MFRILALTYISLLSAGASLANPPESPRVPESPEKFHLFLLAGQSNMAGRGKVEEQDRKVVENILSLDKQGKWTYAIDPLHFDKPKVVGVGLGKSFAIEYTKKHPGITIGLIPCAVGGSPIDAWKPGGYHSSTKTHPFDDCLERMHTTLPQGKLKGILWHQGESDSNPQLSQSYEGKLHTLVKRFRTEFQMPLAPFIVGQLGQFKDRPWNEARHQIDRVHRSLPNTIANTAFVPSDGLQHRGDRTHFDSASYREFGKRYFKAYSELVTKSLNP